MKFFNKLMGKNKNSQSGAEEDFFLENKSQETEKVATKTAPSGKEEGSWLEEDYEEGQLSVDVYQNNDSIVIKSTIAGVKPEDIDISINNDMVTIRGKREIEESISEDDYFYQECYWGGFSRSIILPIEIISDKVEASLKNGVLTVTLPKAKKSKAVSIKVKEENE